MSAALSLYGKARALYGEVGAVWSRGVSYAITALPFWSVISFKAGWMAANKKSSSFACAVHVAAYMLPF